MNQQQYYQNNNQMNMPNGYARTQAPAAASGYTIRVSDAANAAVSAGVQFPIKASVTGTVYWSHITRMVDGEELSKRNQEKRQRGGKFDDVPHYALTLDNASISFDANYPQAVKDFFQQQIRIKQEEDGSYSYKFYGKSKSPYPISVAFGKDDNGMLVPAITMEDGSVMEHAGQMPSELARGLKVTVGIAIFSSPNGYGFGMNGVIMREPVRFYEPANASNAQIKEMLQQMGVTSAAENPKIPISSVPGANAPKIPNMENNMAGTVSGNMPAPTENVAPQSVNPMTPPPMPQPQQAPNYAGGNAQYPNQQNAQNRTNMQPNIAPGFMMPPQDDPASDNYDPMNPQLPFPMPQQTGAEMPLQYNRNFTQ